MVTLIIGKGGVLQGLNWRGKTRHFLRLALQNTSQIVPGSRPTRMFGSNGCLDGL
jgi:hypothetical protein